MRHSPVRSVLLHSAAIALLSLFCAGPVGAVAPAEEPRPFEVDRRGETRLEATPAGQRRLTRSAAWQRFAAAQPGWRVRWDETTATPERLTGPGVRIAYQGGVTDATVEAAARQFVATAGVPGLEGLELTAVRSMATGAGWTGGAADAAGSPGVGPTSAGLRGGSTGWWVHFTQSWRGIPVLGSRLTLRVTPDGRVPAVTNRTWAGIDAPTRPAIPAEQAVRAAAEGFDRIPPAVGEPSLVILPIARTEGPEYRLAWRVETRTGLAGPDEPFGHWISLVDAVNGQLLQRMNNARDAVVKGPVTADVEMVAPNGVYETHGLHSLPAAVNGPAGTLNTSTDLDGQIYVNYGATTGRSVTVGLEGPYGRIENHAAGDGRTTLTVPLPDGDSVGFAVAFTALNSPDSERAAFYHAMTSHDFIKTIEPGFTFCDYPMPIRVELNQTCNAFWDGYGINFFNAGGGCANTGRMATVIMHEYGHAITDFMYRPFFPSGAMHECFSDYYAAIMTNQPVVGPGFRGPGTFIRRIDEDRVFPDDMTGEIHTDGLILASALWDARAALGAAHADSLWHFARYGYSDNFDDYFVDYLIEDDDDGDIYNGTPHLATIAPIFRAHGIGDFGVDVVFTPYADTEDTTRTFPLTARFYSIYPLEPGSVMAHLAFSGPGGESTEDVTLTPTGASREYTTTVAAQPAGTVVSYHFTAEDSSGTPARLPETGEFAFRVGVDTTPPVIAHLPLRDQPVDQEYTFVTARITDNLDKGEGSAMLLVLFGNPPQAGLTSLEPRPTAHDYGAIIPQSISALGDTIRYRIEASDRATTPNGAADPPSGYHAFRIVRGLGRDFEANDGGFVPTGDFTWGPPAGPTHPTAWSGANVWGTKLTGGYSDDVASTLTLPPVDLTGWTNASLVFRHWYDTEPEFDGGRVEISLDGGDSWEPLTPEGGYPVRRVVTFGAPAYNGDSDGWQLAEFDLYRYAGRADVRFRFRFLADQSLHAPGWFLDDVQVVERQTLSRPVELRAGSGLRNRVPVAWSVPAGQEDVVDSPVQGYLVERSTALEPWVRLTPVPITEMSYLDGSAQNGIPCKYRVIAVYAEGESAPAGPVVGFPYTPRMEITPNLYTATLPLEATLDTTLAVANTGTGFLQVNGYVGAVEQTIDELRYEVITGDTTSAGRPPVEPAAAPAAGAGITTDAFPRGKAPAGMPESAGDDAPERLARGLAAAAERGAARRFAGGALRLAGTGAGPAPLGAAAPGDTLGFDADDISNINPDLKTFACRVTGSTIDFQISAWEPWGAFNEFNMVIAMNTDDNSTNGFSGGEFLVVGGSIIQSSFNLPALLIDANFAPVNLLADFRLTNGDSLAEFSVRLNDLADPARITLSILVLDAAGVQLLDRMPERVPAFFSLASRYLVVPFDDPAGFRVRFNSATLTPGFYDAALYLDSTDPASRTATVPIRMVVTNTTPVTLAEFSAAGTEAGVALTWRTSGETDHAGFHVYRREAQGTTAAGADPGERLTDALIPTARDGRYTFVDRTALPGLPYAYTLADISRGGQIQFHGPVTTLAGPALPMALALAPVAPNPARGQALLRYGLPRPGRATLRLFRVDGRLVRTLVDGDELASGWHEARWDGRDDSGAPAPAGLYFARIETPFGALARKLIWAR